MHGGRRMRRPYSPQTMFGYSAMGRSFGAPDSPMSNVARRDYPVTCVDYGKDHTIIAEPRMLLAALSRSSRTHLAFVTVLLT